MTSFIKTTVLALTALAAFVTPSHAGVISAPDPITITNGSAALSIDFNEGLSTATTLVWDLVHLNNFNGSYSLNILDFATRRMADNSHSISNTNNLTLLNAFSFDANTGFRMIQTAPGGSATLSVMLDNPITTVSPFTAFWQLAAGAGGTNVNFSVEIAVPAPGALALLGFGLIGLGLRRSRSA